MAVDLNDPFGKPLTYVPLYSLLSRYEFMSWAYLAFVKYFEMLM